MKILIVSDSHRMNGNLKIAIDREKPDMLIHLGDIEDAERTVALWAGAPKTPCVFISVFSFCLTSLFIRSFPYICSIKIIGCAVQNGVFSMYIPSVSSLSSIRTTDSGDISGNSSFTLSITICGLSFASRT